MTLLETLIVLAIAGLVGLISYPHLERAYRTLDVRVGAQTLAVDLRRARAAALRGGGAAAVVRPNGDGLGYRLADGTLRSLPEGIVIRGAAIRFFADGTTSGGLLLVGDSLHFLGVAVEPATGAIAVVRP